MKIFDPKLTGSIEIQSQVSGSIIPTTNETFDLGSASNRWNDIYLAGSTIDLGGTKMSKDSSGDIEFKDASNNRKKIIVEEILIGSGDNQKTLKVDDGKSMVVDKNGNVITQMAGHIMPHGHDIYDLGSPTAQWRDLYLSSGSLYIDGTQVISSTSNVLTVTTDTGQSLKLLETGADDITIQTDTGNIELKGTVEILSGKKLIDSAGTIIQFGDSLGVTGSIQVSGTVDGIDLQSMSSSLDSRISTLTGKTIISSSAQIATDISGSNTAFSASVATRFEGLTTDYTELDNIPNNIISSSAQIASDISGSFTSASDAIITKIDSNTSNLASLNVATSSYLRNTTDTLNGDLTVTGTITAQQFNSEIVSSSIIFDSGSTKFGDSSDDIHDFTGSLNVLGSITGTVNGYLPLAGGTMTGDLRFQDNRKILMGAGDMFQIKHTGTLSQIATYEGDLFIDNNAADKDIIFRSDDGSGGLAEYFKLDGSFEKTVFLKDIFLNDSVKALFGNSSDLEIYHNATDSVIENKVGDLYITNKQDDGDIIFRSDNGAGGYTPYFKVDGGSVTNQFLKTVKLYDSSQLWIGDDNDLQIFHNGNDSYIKDLGTGDLRIVASATKIYDADMSHLQATFTDGGAVDLYYSGNKKFATTASGIAITGGGTFTTSILASGNSNSFGNTTIAALSASTGTFSASVTAAGNTNSFGATTFTGDINLGTFNTLSGVANDNLILKIDKNNLSGGSTFDIQMDGSTSAFFINNSRNIGIGTTNPVQKLQVNGSIYSNGGEFFVNTNSGITAVGNLIFKAHDGSSYFEGMRIASTGNVGIGTTNPTAKLHVIGDATISGQTTFKPKHYGATADLNNDSRQIFSTHATNNTTSNRPINYSTVYTLGGSVSNALQISTNEDYNESGMWIRQYNLNAASPQGTGWQNWTEVWTTNHAPLTKITNWDTAYTYSQVGHLPLAGGTMNSDATVNMNSGQITSVDYIDFGIGQLNGVSTSNFILKSLGDITYNVDSNSNGNSAHIFQESGNELMRIRYDGKVGIGTNSPSSKLSIRENGAQLSLQRSDATGTEWKFYSWTDGLNIFPAAAKDIFIGRDGASTNLQLHNGILKVLGTGDSYFTGKVGIGTTSPAVKLEINTAAQSAIMLRARYNANYYTDYGSNQLNFTGTNQSFDIKNNGTSALFINSSSNIGIGTTDPTDLLTVAGKILSRYGSSTNHAVIEHRDTSDNVIFSFRRSDGAGGNGNDLVIRAYEDIHLAPNNSDNSKLVVKASGNVGIGTTSPIDKLHVEGVIQSKKQLLPSTSGTAGWYKIGTLEGFIQGGATAVIEIAGHQGYNATNNQDYLIKLFIKTSNGNAGGPNGQGFNSWYERTGGNNATIEFKWDNSATNDYDLYMFIPTHSLRSWYSIKKGTGTWDHAGTSATDPGANSSTVLKATGLFNILDANVGIGTTSPGAKLHVQSSTSDGVIVRTSTNTEPFIAIQRNSGSNGVAVLRSIDGGHLYVDTGATGAAQSTKMTITAAGNVGIGTTTFPTTDIGQRELLVQGAIVSKPPSVDDYYSYLKSNWANDGAFELGIQGADTNHKLITTSNYYHGTQLNFHTSDQKRMVIDTNGNVGIGTTSPNTIMEILGANPILTIRDSDTSTSTATSTIRFAESNASDTLGNYWDVGYSPVNLLNFDFNGSTKMTINSSGNVGIGTTPRTIGNYKVLDISGGTGAGGYIGLSSGSTQQGELYSHSGGVDLVTLGAKYTRFYNNGSERMRITSAGNVGIGTTSPSYKLAVEGSVAVQDAQNLWIRGGRIGFENTALDNAAYIYNIGAAGSSKLNIADSLYVVEAGNVGIGTTAPQTKLHVKGAADDNEALLFIENTYSSGGVFYPAALFKHTASNHSYGTVAEFRTEGTSSDRPGVLFSNGHTSHSWSVGQGVSGANDNFAIGYRNFHPNTAGGWATAYLTISTSGAATFASSINTGGNVTINTTSDNILTLNQTSTDNKWNYINFNNQGTREWFIGQDASGNFDLYNDNIDSNAISVGYTNNAIDLNANTTVSGNLTVEGTLTAQEFRAELTTSTIIYESGSTKFGDTSDDNHDFTGSLNVQGNIKHTGLTMTSGTDIDQLYSTTKSMTLTTSWQDTGINGTDLATGTYVVSVYAHDNAVGGGHWSETYSGTMTWYSGDTNSNDSDEILLHKAGHASSNKNIYLRTKRTATADTDDLKLQIAHSATCTGNSNYVFKFRRLI